MAIYRIAAVRTEFHLIEMVVRANSQDEAERRFEDAFEDPGKHVLGWIEDPGGSETEIESIGPLPRDHDPVPSDADRTQCRYCGRPFYWTGTPAEKSPTGATIPGPWIHWKGPCSLKASVSRALEGYRTRRRRARANPDPPHRSV